MVELSAVHGKTLAVVLYSQTTKGEQGEGAVFFGTACVDKKCLYLDRGNKGPPFEIPNDALGRLKKVSEDIKDTLEGAEYWVWLTVADIPAGENATRYIHTGLKWPV